ncbi:hypothetical protein K9N50_09265 [bacterium]|nr:hypothetical protein [bacterium]
MKIVLRLLPLLLIGVFIISGCNIYDFTAADDDARSIVEEGKQLLRDGDFQGALDKFKEALADDSLNSELRYLHAKAAMRRTGQNTITLATEISTFQTDSQNRTTLPFLDPDEWPKTKADSLYQGVLIAAEDLKLIADSIAVGSIVPKDINLGLAFILAINGLLIFRDTNSDTHIDYKDIDLNVFFVNGRLNIENLGQMVDSLGIESVNNMIDAITDLLINGSLQIDEFLGSGEEDDSGIDNEAMKNVINKIKGGSNIYKIELGIDNDGDWNRLTDDLDGNGVPSADWDGPDEDFNGDGNKLYDPEPHIDEEFLDNIDNDGDNLIDEDSNGSKGI